MKSMELLEEYKLDLSQLLKRKLVKMLVMPYFLRVKLPEKDRPYLLLFENSGTFDGKREGRGS